MTRFIIGFIVLVLVVVFAALFTEWTLRDCPDCPEPVVTTDLLDEVRDSLVVRGGVATAWFDVALADSIAVLNERVEKQQATLNHWDTAGSPSFRYWERKLHPGTVSIAAVDSLFDANKNPYAQPNGDIVWMAWITSFDLEKFKQGRK